MTRPQHETLLDTKAAAERLGLAVQTLHNWRTKATGPRYYKIGSRVRYKLADLDKWIASQESMASRSSEYIAKFGTT